MMFYLAVIVLIFTGLQLLVALVNLVFGQRLNDVLNTGELVSVLIPARNEEKNIGLLLSDLQKQLHQNLEILVFDDESTDATAEIVKQFTASDSRIRLIASTGLEPGWLGKNFACHQLALQSSGKYLLFLDADVRTGPTLIRKLLSKTRKDKLGLVSIFPRQMMLSPGEWMTVPVMNFILLTLLPLILVQKSSYPSLSAANGQCMLFDADVYKARWPHQLMRNHKVEDIAIIRQLKQEEVPVACLTGEIEVACRMYGNFGEAVNGFSKNIVMFFGNSMLLAVFFWAITTLGFIPVLLAMPAWVILAFFATLLLIRVVVSLASRQNVLMNLLYLLPQQIAMGLMILKSGSKTLKKQYTWKGRNIG